MRKTFFKTFCVAILVCSCQQESKPDPYEIDTNKIGLLTNTIQVKQLDSIFSNDSIAKRSAGDQYLTSSSEIEVFEKGGVKLLVLEPKTEADPNSTIENIQVIDPRYKTASGLSTQGVFKDIRDHYVISKINNTLSTAVIFVDSIQAYFTIDKKELPQKFRQTTDIEIKSQDIPDSAKIKHFWISWDAN